MSWAKLDDRFPWHKKVRRLSDAAYRLHTTAIIYCARDETDGFVAAEDIEEMPGIKRAEKSIAELVERELWDVVEGGWEVHDFLEYNPSADQQARARAAAAERQRKARERRIERDGGSDSTSRRD